MTGCYNYRELNDLAIVSGISISKEDELYKITAEVVNPKKPQDTSSGKEPDFITYTATGESLQEALRNVIKESPQKLYAAHMDILIIDEIVAKNDLKRILDFCARDPEIRSEFYVLVGKMSDILSVTTPLENLSSKNILDSLRANNSFLGFSNLVTYHDLIADYLNPNIEIALPSVSVVGNEKKGEKVKNIETTDSDAASVISGVAVFKNNRLKGYLSDEESLAFNIVMGNTKTFLIKTDYKDKQFMINEILQSKTKLEGKPKENKIVIEIKGTTSISELDYDCDLKSSRTMERLQKDLNHTVETFLKEAITDIIQKYNSDIFGFQDLFYKKDPKVYQNLKKNWDKGGFENLNIEVKSNLMIIEKGNLNGGVYHE